MNEFNGKLEVKAQDEDGTFTWHEADEILENGWRLPTKSELNYMHKQKESLGGFVGAFYWSASETNSDFAWIQDFIDGYENSLYKNSSFRVRAVRSIGEEK
jgi:hypothetical protein